MQLILLVECSRISGSPQSSIICQLFKDPPGLDAEANFTDHGRKIAEILLHEALTAPPHNPAVPSTLVFSLGVLRFCIAAPNEVVPETLVEQIFELAGDIGTELRNELQKILLVD